MVEHRGTYSSGRNGLKGAPYPIHRACLSHHVNPCGSQHVPSLALAVDGTDTMDD
jgi:hypothetical protein